MDNLSRKVQPSQRLKTSSPHISSISLKTTARNPMMVSHGIRLITCCNLSLALKVVFTTSRNRARKQRFGRKESEHLSCWKCKSSIPTPCHSAAWHQSTPTHAAHGRTRGTAPSPHHSNQLRTGFWVMHSIRHSPVSLMQTQAGIHITGCKQTGLGLARCPRYVYQKDFCK